MALIKHKSVSLSHLHGDLGKKDERATRSRRRLDAAFVELLYRRAYGNIRVADIAKKAGVGRATFYAHYSSKDEFLWSQFNRVVAPMLVIQQGQACPIDATAFFKHIQMSPRFFKALTSGPEAGSAPRVLRDCFEERVRQALESRGDSARTEPQLTLAVQQATVTRAIASSLLAVVECWVESDLSQSPQEVQAIFSKLVGGGLNAFRS
jgi:AcrR family transcriptional regulator